MEQRSDRFTAIEDQYADYTVYDRDGDKIGKVDDLFVDENDQPEYIGVKMGFLGTRSTLIPWEIATVDENDRRIEVSVDKAQAKEGPSFDDDQDITPDYEEQVYSHYGLQRAQTNGEGSGYGDYYGDDEAGKVGPGMREGDTETGEFRGHAEDDEGVHQSHGSDLEDEDELRVQRTEESSGRHPRARGRQAQRPQARSHGPRAGEGAHQARGGLVERVPVNEERTGAEIGEDEVSMPVVEEEAVVGKESVVKEEVRVRKDVVEDEEVVEEDVRKERSTSTTRRPGAATGKKSKILVEERVRVFPDPPVFGRIA
jgi:stress response protein YsnF